MMFQSSWPIAFSYFFIVQTLCTFPLSRAASLRNSGLGRSDVLNVVQDTWDCRLPGTSKLHPRCRGRALHYLRTGLVTGVGRSGTHTVSALFKAVGLQLPHEKVGRDGSVSWVYAVDASKVPRLSHDCGWLYPPGTLFQNVVHLSRCPIKTISSLTTAKSCSLMYMMRAKHMNIPALQRVHAIHQPLLSQHMPRSNVMIASAKLWLAWTQGVSKQADTHVRVEDLSQPAVLLHLCRSTVGNHPACARMQYLSVAHIRRSKGNSRKHPDFSYQELSRAAPLLAQKVLAEGKRLGYGPECFGWGGYGGVGLAIIPDAAVVPLGNNATARLYHRLPETGNSTKLTAEMPRNASILVGTRGEEELCTCGEEAGWEQEEQDEDDQDDSDLCLCVKAQAPGAKEMLSAAFDRSIFNETSKK